MRLTVEKVQMFDAQHGGKGRELANLVGLCALAYTGRAVHVVARIRHHSAPTFIDRTSDPCAAVTGTVV